MKLPAAPPADPTNEYGDVPAAAVLGKKLFEDVALSPSGTVACVTCHDPTKAFGDGLKTGKGVSTGDRNSPAIALSAHARWQFWDGRADTLWMQALGPFENDKEFASSRLFVVRKIEQSYKNEYDAVFGAKYPFPDLSGFVLQSGKPGDAAYDALPQADTGPRRARLRERRQGDRGVRAHAAREAQRPRSLRGGDTTALQGKQRQALDQFFHIGCVQCHWGPRLSDDAFHTLRFPTGRQDGVADQGRAAVLLGLASSEFVATSKWSDAPQAAKPLLFTVAPPSMVGAFKTPTLRGVSTSAPYGHGGTFAALSDVSKHYGTRAQEVVPAAAAGTRRGVGPNFDANVQTDLPQLLDVLTADQAP